jgi:hypothetical protein
MTRSRIRPRRRKRVIAVALANFALVLVAAPAASADNVQSSNWAGYAAHRGSVKFKRVSGTWRQPKATCTPGHATYSSVWVGLGGYSRSSKALEQIGSEVDCNAGGKVVSSAWYELVPAPSRTIRMQVRPGDKLRATVTVTGHQVRLSLRDLTKGHTFTRTVKVSQLDVSSAEWILETPSLCSGGVACQVLPLADFGSATVTGATATTTRGASGPISSRAWNTSKITLASGGHHFISGGAGSAGVGASPSSLAARGNSFTITYEGPVTAAATSTSVRRASVRSETLTRPARAGAQRIAP